MGNYKDISMLLFHSMCFNFYLFQLFYGSWNELIVRGYLYAFMCVVTLYLAFSPNSQFNLINKLTFAFNFALFFLTLLGIFKEGVFYMLVYNGSIIVTTVMILTSGLRHGIFKQSFNDGE